MSEVKKYRKKPVVIEAMQLDHNASAILGWVTQHGGIAKWQLDEYGPVYIETLEGDMRATHGDFIIKGVNGEFYPCKPDIFAKTYEVSL